MRREAEPADVDEPAILVRINRYFRSDMPRQELYDYTRGVWIIGGRRDLAEYAIAVFGGIVQEVYEIADWYPAGSTYSSRNERGVRSEGRWEFVGRVADDGVRDKYLGRSVAHYFARGAQNPIKYVNIPK